MAHIKRPPNAYMLFLAECRANAVIKLLAKTQMELCRLVGRAWAILPEAERKVYYDQAALLAAHFAIAYPHYVYKSRRTGKKSRVC